MLLFIFDKDIQSGDRAPFRLRHTPATTPIPTPSASDNLGHPSKPDWRGFHGSESYNFGEN